jgi:hypothetical protein
MITLWSDVRWSGFSSFQRFVDISRRFRLQSQMLVAPVTVSPTVLFYHQMLA